MTTIWWLVCILAFVFSFPVLSILQCRLSWPDNITVRTSERPEGLPVTGGSLAQKFANPWVRPTTSCILTYVQLNRSIAVSGWCHHLPSEKIAKQLRWLKLLIRTRHVIPAYFPIYIFKKVNGSRGGLFAQSRCADLNDLHRNIVYCSRYCMSVQRRQGGHTAAGRAPRCRAAERQDARP